MEINIRMSSEHLSNLDDFVEITEIDEGRKTYYQMSLSNLLSVLTSSITVGQREESPLLPRNCVKFVKTLDGYEVYVDVSKNRWIINFEGNYLEVGFPRLLFKYVLSRSDKGKEKYKVCINRIFALEGKNAIQGDTPLYVFPYSHVQRDGRVCMGGNVLKGINCLSELENYHLHFIQSPFGQDYGAKTTLRKNLTELIVETFHEKDFDDTVLVPTNKSFNEMFLFRKED